MVRSQFRRGWLGAGFISLLVGFGPVWAAGLSLAQLPLYDDLDLSADGEHLLMLRSGGESYNLVVRHLATGDDRVLYQGNHKEGLLNWCRWANAERIVCSVRFYAPAPKLGQITRTRLFAVDVNGGPRQMLVPRARNYQRRPPVWNAQVQDRVVSWLVTDLQHILIQLNRDARNRPGVYRLNIYSNSLSRVVRPRGKVRRWYATHDGDVRMAIGYHRDREPMVYSTNGRRLREFTGPAYDSEIPPQPLGFTADEAQVFLSMSNGRDRHGIYRVDVQTGEVLEEIFRDPDFDVFGGIILHPETGEPVGVSYLRHHPRLVWFDDRLEQLFNAMRQALPGEQMELISTDQAYTRFVLYSYGGVSPGYFLYDLRDGGSLTDLGKSFPQLRDEQVVDLQPMHYTSRDGVRIPAYLAQPDSAGPHPTILLPHGGPYARDSAEFDSWTQFLVDQGYAVLKPNYRGSVGYGQVHMQAGYKQWGLKMQEDLMDGLNHLVAQGIADPQRVCVVGASYGGYSALVSAYKFAEKIQCAVSLAGISDLEQMVERLYNYDLAQRNRERIQASKDLRANSPIRQVQHFDVPVLMLHGIQDTVVRVKQSRRLAAALADNGKTFRYVEQNGDHFLSTSSQRVEFFSELRGWLQAHVSTEF